MVGVENFISKNREQFVPHMKVLRGDKDAVLERKESEELDIMKRKVFLRYRTDFIKEIRHSKTQEAISTYLNRKRNKRLLTLQKVT